MILERMLDGDADGAVEAATRAHIAPAKAIASMVYKTEPVGRLPCGRIHQPLTRTLT